MTRRPPRATRTHTLFPYHCALPICLTSRRRAARRLTMTRRAPVAVMLGTAVLLGAAASTGEPAFTPIQPDLLAMPGSLSNSWGDFDNDDRSEEQTSELQSLMRISYSVFCLEKKKIQHEIQTT